MTAGLEVRVLRRTERPAALALLAEQPVQNLAIVDAVRRLGQAPSSGELRARALAVWQGGALRGVASLNPSIAISAGADASVVEALLPHLTIGGAGLVKTREAEAALLWERIQGLGRRAILDRFEIGFAVDAKSASVCDPPAGVRSRAAGPDDLDDLVEAARASLREEDRPDPFEGDAEGFRRWVAGRLGRAQLLERGGETCFVGYADVQAPEGWLIQGVYTWPDERRRGLATAGMSALCRQALDAGAGHVQLAVVEGNEPGIALYRSLGFEPFARLRTLLFC